LRQAGQHSPGAAAAVGTVPGGQLGQGVRVHSTRPRSQRQLWQSEELHWEPCGRVISSCSQAAGARAGAQPDREQTEVSSGEQKQAVHVSGLNSSPML
jgi:hypothetical protein